MQRLIALLILFLTAGVSDSGGTASLEPGLELIIDQNAGLREVYEPEGGNRITISRNGILHSAGPEAR